MKSNKNKVMTNQEKYGVAKTKMNQSHLEVRLWLL
jgi:hypothetical protein